MSEREQKSERKKKQTVKIASSTSINLDQFEVTEKNTFIIPLHLFKQLPFYLICGLFSSSFCYLLLHVHTHTRTHNTYTFKDKKKIHTHNFTMLLFGQKSMKLPCQKTHGERERKKREIED